MLSTVCLRLSLGNGRLLSLQVAALQGPLLSEEEPFALHLDSRARDYKTEPQTKSSGMDEIAPDGGASRAGPRSWWSDLRRS
jgi:hypothetical protein